MDQIKAIKARVKGAVNFVSKFEDQIVELARRTDVPVFAGCQNPLMRPLVTAEYVMGNDGLAGAELPAPTTARRTSHAVDFIVDTLEAAAEPVTMLVIVRP